MNNFLFWYLFTESIKAEQSSPPLSSVYSRWDQQLLFVLSWSKKKKNKPFLPPDLIKFRTSTNQDQTTIWPKENIVNAESRRSKLARNQLSGEQSKHKVTIRYYPPATAVTRLTNVAVNSYSLWWSFLTFYLADLKMQLFHFDVDIT